MKLSFLFETSHGRFTLKIPTLLYLLSKPNWSDIKIMQENFFLHEMIQSRETGGQFTGKQESSSATSTNSASSGSITTSWTRLKDPRIVRVSPAHGSKDRHSKVCTVRGLRDRRVRLSVPTAIQLYDLQDRLGLNQPSKVVDWLLNAAKHEIDELPPLQIPQGCFLQNLDNQQSLVSTSARSEEVHVANETLTATFNPFVRWHPEDPPPQGFGLVQWQSPPSVASGSHPVLVYQQHAISAPAQTYFPSEMPSLNIDSPAGESSSRHVRSFHFSMAGNLLPNNEQNKHDEFRL